VLVLAFDTSTAAVTVALHDGSQVVAEATTVDAMRHGELLAPAVAGALADAGRDRRELTEVVVGVGPGPFTGLRVGLVTARVLGAVLSIPVRGACSLDVTAVAVRAGAPFLVAQDARRREVYWAAYDQDGRRTDGPHVDRPADVASPMPTAGRGAALYPDAFPHRVAPELPSAADLARAHVAGTLELLPPEPLYLRRPDATEPGARKRVST
jgi:tRNA threonylcarbamoyladenosine biosynthesis protein TsaB